MGSQEQDEVFDSAQDLLRWGEIGCHKLFCGDFQGSRVEERLSLGQRVIECENDREGSEILHGFQDGARCVLNELEVDLGAIILATLPNSSPKTLRLFG